VFYEHAANTNDVFRLAAKLLASVCIAAATDVAALGRGACGSSAGDEGGGSSSGMTAVCDWPTPLQALTQPAGTSSQPAPSAVQALARAWLPYAVGWKRLWWEAVAVPRDVQQQEEEGGELEFRSSLRCVCGLGH
jgi:hypothetical protein